MVDEPAGNKAKLLPSGPGSHHCRAGWLMVNSRLPAVGDQPAGVLSALLSVIWEG